MPTTSNFGWTTPADTDLVKNGALAIRTLGNGIDTSMAELKGGTTGQVLSKSSNTDMDFTWVTTDDANAIQNAIVDAKGDLIAATANDTPARLAVGNNGETLVADSSTTTGLRWQGSLAAGRNFVINGGMDIWQRGTSFTANNAYTADRWYVSTVTTNFTVSRQTTSDTTNLPFIQYSTRVQRNSGQTGTGDQNITQSLESVNSIPLAGRTITLSFYLRVGANYSGGATFTSQVRSGTGTDQNVANGFTGSNSFISNAITPTTTWTRYSYSGTVPTTATQLGVYFGYTPSGTAGANDWFEVTGVQVELGSVATAFSRAQGTLAGELAACQRYYNRWTAGSGGTYPLATGAYYTTTVMYPTIIFPQEMRIAPTAIGTSAASAINTYVGGAAATSSAIAFNSAGSKSMDISVTTGAKTVGDGGGVALVANAWLEVSAEL